MKKISFSLLFSLLLLAAFATVAMAEDPAGEQDPVGGYNEEAELKNIENINLNAHNTDGSSKSGGRHGNYTNNTNACSTCHQTHVASSESLVFADSVYQSCIACHDGTSGGNHRNVLNTNFEYVMERNSPDEDGETTTTAGIFSGTHTSNMSAHLTTGAVAIKAAPGGDPDGDGSAFTCASCHNPHGSYSSKYLHHNPNGMVSVPVEEGGRRLVDVNVYAKGSEPNRPEQDHDYIFVRSTKEAEGLLEEGETNEDVIVLKRAIYRRGNVDAWVRDESPWLDGTWRFSVNAEDADLRSVEGANVNRLDAYVSGNVSGITKMTVNRAYYVNLPRDRSDLWASGSQIQGIQVSEFCASCHNDYLVSSGGSTSLWDEDKTIYGHTTDANSYTCLRCHYAHGTTAEIMIDAKGESITSLVADGWDQQDAFNHILDANPSSALKKFTNMSSCIACHTSSKSGNIINTFRLVDDGPSGMPSGR